MPNGGDLKQSTSVRLSFAPSPVSPCSGRMPVYDNPPNCCICGALAFDALHRIELDNEDIAQQSLKLQNCTGIQFR